METTTGISAPPIGMMMSTPSTKAKASIKKNASQLSVRIKATPSPTVAMPKARLTMCWPLKVTGAPWKSRNLYFPESLPKAMTEPLKVIAPIAAPKKSSNRLPTGMGWPLGVMFKA